MTENKRKLIFVVGENGKTDFATAITRKTNGETMPYKLECPLRLAEGWNVKISLSEDVRITELFLNFAFKQSCKFLDLDFKF